MIKMSFYKLPMTGCLPSYLLNAMSFEKFSNYNSYITLKEHNIVSLEKNALAWSLLAFKDALNIIKKNIIIE